MRSNDGPESSLCIAKLRSHKTHVLTSFDGIASAEEAQRLIGRSVWTVRSNVTLAQNEYFDDDLIGCRVLQEERQLGTVVAVRHFPAQDMIELDTGALIPMVGAFIRAVDLRMQNVYVELPPGLVDGEPL